MDLKKRTFEDLIGNLADDAKKALGEGLERESTPKNWTPAGPPGVTPPVGTSSGQSSCYRRGWWLGHYCQ
jgi:hypothetical protein